MGFFSISQNLLDSGFDGRCIDLAFGRQLHFLVQALHFVADGINVLLQSSNVGSELPCHLCIIRFYRCLSGV